jgi:hypothetical protein
MNKLTESQKKQILELYFNSSDNSLTLIADVVGCKYEQASAYIDYFLSERNDEIIKFKSNTKIFHSSINRQN